MLHSEDIEQKAIPGIIFREGMEELRQIVFPNYEMLIDSLIKITESQWYSFQRTKTLRNYWAKVRYVYVTVMCKIDLLDNMTTEIQLTNFFLYRSIVVYFYEELAFPCVFSMINVCLSYGLHKCFRIRWTLRWPSLLMSDEVRSRILGGNSPK